MKITGQQLGHFGMRGAKTEVIQGSIGKITCIFMFETYLNVKN